MARKARPWWWEAEQGWYVNRNGRRVPLGKHPEGAAPPRKSTRTGHWNAPQQILDAFHELMSGAKDSATGGAPAEPASVPEETVAGVLKDFVSWGRKHLAPRTIDRYKDFLNDLVNFKDAGVQVGLLPALSITPKHVTRWLDSHPSWGATTQKNAITSVQRAYNWAVSNLGLERNPLKGMKKPQGQTRAQVILPADFERLLTHASPHFRDLLVVSYDSGARPFEIKELESRHVDLARQRAVIPASEAKGRRKTRTIYFPSERSMEIIRRLCSAHTTGPLFRNSRGNKWNGFSVKNAFEDVQVAIGLEEMRRKGVESAVTEVAVQALAATLKTTRRTRLTGREVEKKPKELLAEARRKLVMDEAKKHAGRISHYSLRHSFVTRSLVAGVDSHVVAKLAGHQDSKMLDTVYSHVADDYEYMLEQARRTAGLGNGSNPTPRPNDGRG